MRHSLIFNSVVFSLFCLPHFANAEGGAESMNRPSEKLPELPLFESNTKERFSLPLVPISPADSQPDALDKTLAITQIQVEGNTVLENDLLRELVAPYENRVVTLVEIEELRKKITRLYIEKGYANSGAIIPNDGFKNGVLLYVIVEGKIDDIRLRGQEGLRENYIKNRLITDTSEPFNLLELQENFQALLSDPLISRLNGRILPGDSAGHNVLDVEVTRAKPYQLSLLGNNFRPPSVGAEAFGLTGTMRNLTTFGESWDFTFFNSEGSTRYAGGVNFPITDWGTNAFFHFDESESNVLDSQLKKINIQSQVHSLEGGLNHFFINNSQHKLSLGSLIAIRENETSLLNRSFSFNPGIATGHNQATVIRFFQDYLLRGESQALALRSTFSIGLDALGSISANKNYQSSDFYAWLGQFQYAQRLFENNTQLIFRGNTQFSNKPLLPLERLSVGGMYSVRGYRENTLVRDEGFSLSAELHYPIYGNTQQHDDFLINLVPFSDFGRAWNLNESPTSLASVGMGLDFQIKSLHGEIYYGYALIQNSLQYAGDLQDQGVHFQTRLDLF